MSDPVLRLQFTPKGAEWRATVEEVHALEKRVCEHALARIPKELINFIQVDRQQTATYILRDRLERKLAQHGLPAVIRIHFHDHNLELEHPWPSLTAMLTHTEAAKFKMFHSDDYEIVAVPA